MGLSLLGILGGLGSDIIGGLFSNNGYADIAKALNSATATQKNEYQQGLSLLNPYITGGNTALGYQLGALGLPGGVSSSDAMNAFRNSPGYQWGLTQGLNGVQTSAAANGDLFSGNTLKDLNNYAQGYADQSFGNWFNRVGGLAGMGQGAAGSAVNLGSKTADTLSGLALNGGLAGAQNASNLSGDINQGIGSLADLVKLLGANGGGSTSSYTGVGTPDAYQYSRMSL